MEGELDLPLGRIAIYPMLETAQAIRLAYEIAAASPRVRYMGGAISRFGDIHQAVGYRWSAEGTETLYLRSKVLIDAQGRRESATRSVECGAAPPTTLDGLRAWCTHLRDLGYYGMMIGNAGACAAGARDFQPVERGADVLVRPRPAGDRRRGGPAAVEVVYGDANQGEGHVVHLAHVESARHNLSWAHALGVVESAGGVENVEGASVL